MTKNNVRSLNLIFFLLFSTLFIKYILGFRVNFLLLLLFLKHRFWRLGFKNFLLIFVKHKFYKKC